MYKLITEMLQLHGSTFRRLEIEDMLRIHTRTGLAPQFVRITCNAFSRMLKTSVTAEKKLSGILPCHVTHITTTQLHPI